ncbi:MAG: molybdopterin molybdotransferase MoeA [Planctomycetes bacterium]|nr:molybdopterin molybdotransferase MoeA [Planctomycetota bacterium]
MAALTLRDARAHVLASCREPLGLESVGLFDAHGRVLGEDVVSAGPWPATDRSAMDGFAVRAGDAGLPAGTRCDVVGQSLAGSPFAGELPAGAAIRIMTGAVVPAGADAVVPVENTSGFQSSPVTLQAQVRRGQNVRPLGSELAAGQRVLVRGDRVGAAAIGVLAVLGRTNVAVVRRPRVAIVATGDEVVPVETVPLPHQVRESNSWATAAQVRECGGEPWRLGVAPDEPVALRRLLQEGLDGADVLVTIGGISKGTHDLVHGTLREIGVRTEFHGIDLKPGKPTYFGTRSTARGARWIFGLPGNPASAFTVFDLLVRPLLVAVCGGEPGELIAAARAGGSPWVTNSRLQAVPARARVAADGSFVADLAPASPSGDPFGLLHRDGYVLVPNQAPWGDGVLVPFVGGSGGLALP